MMKSLPVILLKGLILLPNQEVKVELNNKLSKKVILLSDKEYKSELLIVSPQDKLEEIPEVSDLPTIGVIGTIKNKIELPNGHLRVTIHGEKRVKIDKYYNYEKDKEILMCYEKAISLPKINEQEETAIKRKLQTLLKKYIKNNPMMPNTVLGLINNKQSLDEMADIIASYAPLTFEKKIALMIEMNPLIRGKILLEDINTELEIIKIDQELSLSIQKSLDDNQKEFLLREKMKEIQKELGEDKEKNIEIKEWTNKLENLQIDSKTLKKVEKEIVKYEKMNELSPDASFVRNYLDTFFSLPWQKFTYDKTDITEIQKNLNDSHYGLDEVKTRIIEYVAIKKRNPSLRSPILCLVGPPGVGKTSIAMSIANALGKEFYKISVGGINDATILIGHRRTYLGSSPGKIMEAIIKCGTNNPVILIDEVDKMTKDYHSDPASVLLDVLDFPQNKTFIDNYIEEPFDLSNVLFILTANDINKIPLELKDRLEIINLSSYTLYEKIILARDYLLPQIFNEYGVLDKEITIPDGVISSLIVHYTLEAGVRDLKRKLEMLIRKVLTTNVHLKRKLTCVLEEKDLKKYLDVYQYENDVLPKNVVPGLVQALALTGLGGRILSLETCLFKGTGQIIMTGSLKEVIKESITVALDYIKSHSKELKITTFTFQDKDIHLHAIDGATPKDGPSAGIAIVTSILSLIKQIPVSQNIAFTGEITLRGEILPVGGVKEKLIGAYNAGIQKVFIPKLNKKDLKKVPPYILENMTIVAVSSYKEVYKEIFKAKKEEPE